MEAVQPPTKKLRKRSKSTHQKENSPTPDGEKAPNLNGDDVINDKPSDNNKVNDEAKEQEFKTVQSEDKSKSDGEINESSTKGRKRKASELKDDDSIKEEPKEKDEAMKDTAEVEQMDDEKNESDNNTSINEVADDSKEIRLLPKETLGKGKRARIPNKRYSDILLSTSPKGHSIDGDKLRHKTAVENGETPINSEISEKENVGSDSSSHAELNTTKHDLEIITSSAGSSPAVTTLKSRSSITGSPAAKKAKAAVDLSNPNYLKPFEYGWKRELVYRAMSDSSSKRNGDIYYYTPSGKKVRSMREVSENLKDKKLSLDDFTFFKEPLGLDDPEKEIIREAKFKSSVPFRKSTGTPKAKTPKTPSPKVVPIPSQAKTTTPLAADGKRTKTTPKSGVYQVKLSSTRAKQIKPKKKEEEDEGMDDGSYPLWHQTKKTKWGNNLNQLDHKPCRPCSITCQGVAGLIPSLQCRVCLCLYHNECVGLAPLPNIQGYVCKNCQMEQEGSTSSAPTVAPPPLTPINTLKSITTQSTSLPKLQRIPRPGDNVQSEVGKSELPRLTPRPGIVSTVPKYVKVPEGQATHGESKGLVGSVTTWFPPSSTIQLKSTQLGPVQAPRPQFVEYLGNKKYLVIPKHSVLSVSPTIAATASSSAEDIVSTPDNRLDESIGSENMPPDSAKLGPETLAAEIVSDIKLEPESPSRPIPVNTYTDPFSLDFASLLQEVHDKENNQAEGSDAEANEVAESAKSKKSPRTSNTTIATGKSGGNSYMDKYLQNLAYGYNTLLYVFQYLKVQDLLRAGCVCHMWRDIASHPVLWRTVRMKNSQVHSFEGLANTLQKHNTVHLDLRKMLLPSGGDEIWPSFSQAIKKVDSLRKIELCRCPATVVEQLPLSNPKLEVINAVTIKCETMSLAPFRSLKNLQELRLKSTAGLTLTSDLFALQELIQLKHLSLTSIKDLNKQNIDVIADLRNLESLDLGECTDFPTTFGSDILTRLNKLEKLRLEKGQGICYTFEILEAVKNMPHLEQLELVNFDIKTGFDKALGACTNIKKLLIIPTYISQSATTNHMVLGGVLRLRSTLSHFVWGVTLELLRVTELFVDQCEEPEKKDKKEKKTPSNGDSIPVLKPVPLLTDNTTEILPAHEPPQVEILPLPNLQKLLLQSLPTTRVKILKIPFHATWRQSITDTVN